MTSLVRPGGPLDKALATGATYRQLVYWKAKGWIAPSSAAAGSGYQDHWTPSDTARIRTLVSLVRLVGVPRDEHMRALWKHLEVDPLMARWVALEEDGTVSTAVDPAVLAARITVFHSAQP